VIPGSIGVGGLGGWRRVPGSQVREGWPLARGG